MTERDIRDVARYRDLLQHALRTVSLSRNEALLLCEVLQDTFIDASTARQLHHETLAAVRQSRLAEKYSLDISAFIAKISAYNDLQRMAIVDAIERACEASNGSLETRLSASGLLAGATSGAGHADDTKILSSWMAYVNEAISPEQRRHMRPENMLFEVSEGLAPNTLVYTGEGWAWWDDTQQAWFSACWPELVRMRPLLPSQAVQRARQLRIPDAEKVADDLIAQGCPVFAPKTQYSLPDGTVLTARWDGEGQWWFDLSETEETVVTVDAGSGLLCAELRSELGMSSRRKWRNGVFSYRDLRQCG